MTDGDNNPWPQRLVDRKWRLDEGRSQAMGPAAPPGSHRRPQRSRRPQRRGPFSRSPRSGPNESLARCNRQNRRAHSQPHYRMEADTFGFAGSCDRHPDHNSVGVLFRLALRHLREAAQLKLWNYLVHGHNEAFFRAADPLSQTEAHRIDKIRAIRCHRSQVTLSRRRFLGYAGRPEFFAPLMNGETGGEGALRYSFERIRPFISASIFERNLDFQETRARSSWSAMIVMAQPSRGESGCRFGRESWRLKIGRRANLFRLRSFRQITRRDGC